jgi:hypothetical protein
MPEGDLSRGERFICQDNRQRDDGREVRRASLISRVSAAAGFMAPKLRALASNFVVGITRAEVNPRIRNCIEYTKIRYISNLYFENNLAFVGMSSRLHAGTIRRCPVSRLLDDA